MLRDPLPEDVEPFVRAFVADAPLSDALGHDDAPDAQEARTMFEAEPQARAAGERVRLVIADPATDRFAGDLLLHHVEWRHRRAEVGIFVVPGHRRRGMACEALRLACGWAFDVLGLLRVGLMTDVVNEATQRLAARAGFMREGVLRSYFVERGEPRDVVAFSLLAAEAAR